jgi:hypothetical protein
MAALSRAFTNSGKKVVKAPKKAVGKQRDQAGETLKCARAPPPPRSALVP